MSKKSDGNRAIIIDDQFVPMLRAIPKEQAGELLQAMLDYQCDEEVRIEDQSLLAIFLMLRESIDRNNEAYEKKRAAQVENGKKGGRPRKQTASEETQENPRVFAETQQNPEKPDMDMDKDIKKKNSPTESKKKKRFVPPTEEEVTQYVKENGLDIDAVHFYNHYASQNWKKSNGQPVSDWKRCIVTWKRNDEKFGNRSSPKKEYHNRYNDFPQRDNDYAKIQEEWIRSAFGA